LIGEFGRDNSPQNWSYDLYDLYRDTESNPMSDEDDSIIGLIGFTDGEGTIEHGSKVIKSPGDDPASVDMEELRNKFGKQRMK